MSFIHNNNGGKTGMNLALQYAEEAIGLAGNYPGLYNNYAEIVAYALEEGIR